MTTLQPLTTPTKKAVTPEPGPWTGGSKKDTRQNILDHIAKSGLADHHKAMLTAAVNNLDKSVSLVRLDFWRHEFGGGENGTWTVTPLT